MALTALDLTPEEWKAYHPMESVRRWKEAYRADLVNRRRRARRTARKASELLRTEFGATAVILFGSLTLPGRFTPWSDIDLAASGIPPDRYFEAVGTVIDLSAEFKIDLIDLDTCPPSFKEVIEAEGKAL